MSKDVSANYLNSEVCVVVIEYRMKFFHYNSGGPLPAAARMILPKWIKKLSRF